MIKNNTTYYDTYNDRYIITTGVCANPKTWLCVVEEYNEDVDDIIITGSQLFNEYELNKFEELN